MNVLLFSIISFIMMFNIIRNLIKPSIKLNYKLSNSIFYKGCANNFYFKLTNNKTIYFELCQDKNKQYQHIIEEDIMVNSDLLRLGPIRNKILEILNLMNNENFFINTNYEKIYFLFHGKNIVYQIDNPSGNKNEICVIQLEFFKDYSLF